MIVASSTYPPNKRRSVGEVALRVLTNVAPQRAAEHLHDVGPRQMLEAMAEIVAGAQLDIVLSRNHQIYSDIMRVLAGDNLPALPVHEVAS